MPFDANSVIGDILKAKPKATEVFQKHTGRPIAAGANPRVIAATIQQLATFAGWNKEKVDAILKDLNAL